jgi:hypothetical protein
MFNQILESDRFELHTVFYATFRYDALLVTHLLSRDKENSKLTT